MPGCHSITLGADKSHNAAAFVAALWAPKFIPVWPRTPADINRALISGLCRQGYSASQKATERIKNASGWIEFEPTANHIL